MQVVEDAAAEYLTYYAGKVVGMIRAPDEFIYPPPFNLIETFLIAPFEFVFLQLCSMDSTSLYSRFFVSDKAYTEVRT